MKYLLIPVLMLLTISLNSYLSSVNNNLWELRYKQCKYGMISREERALEEDIFACVQKDPGIKILGIIFVRQRSYLQ